MANPMMQAAEFTQAMQNELHKNLTRWSNWMSDFVVSPAEPPMAQTSRDLVWKRGKIQLYRYPSQAAQRQPLPYPYNDTCLDMLNCPAYAASKYSDHLSQETADVTSMSHARRGVLHPAV